MRKNYTPLYGAIIGDICGSVYEFKKPRVKNVNPILFAPGCHYTDDTVMTVATAHWILDGRKTPIEDVYRWYGLKYPKAGYGGMFRRWLEDSTMGPYNSFGNGSAMRVSPVAYANSTLRDVLDEAKVTAECTHNHPEGIKGAQAVAAAIYLVIDSRSKKKVKDYLKSITDYDLDTPLNEIRPNYSFDATCQGSVPQAIRCFLEANSYEETIKLAISLGGDTDTQAAIAGSIAEDLYGIPQWMIDEANKYLPDEFIEIANKFLYI